LKDSLKLQLLTKFQVHLNFIFIGVHSFNFLDVPIPFVSKPAKYEALDAELTRVGKVQLEILGKQIGALHKVFNDSIAHYAPITALIQSSGSGKTRIILELLKTHPGIYMPLSSTSNCYLVPAEIAWIKSCLDFAFSTNAYAFIPRDDDYCKAKDYYCTRFLLVLDFVLSAYLKRLQNLIDEGKSMPDILEYFIHQFRQRNVTSEQYYNSSQEWYRSIDPRTEETLKESNISVASLINRIKLNLNNMNKYCTNDIPFLLIFDNAECMSGFTYGGLSCMKIIKSALHLLEMHVSLMAVAVGTDVNVLEFPPPSNVLLPKPTFDSSARWVARTKHLPTLFLAGNYDVYLEDYPVHLLKLDKKLLCSDAMFKILVLMGSPFWSSCNFKCIFYDAKSKIENGSPKSVLSSFVLLSSRASASINPHHILAEALIRAYMIPTNYVSYDARELIVGYSSDPIMALVSREIICIRNESSYEEAFASLRYLYKQHAIDFSRKDLYVFELFCLFAVDSVRYCSSMTSYPLPDHDHSVPKDVPIEFKPLFKCKNNFAETLHKLKQGEPIEEEYIIREIGYKIINVAHFIMYSFGSDVLERVSSLLPSKILNGIVNISHFVNLDEKVASNGPNGVKNIIDKSLLKCGLLRQCGFVLSPGYSGIDFIIPFAFERDSSKMDNSNETETTYSFIAVKSKSHPESTSSCALQMEMSFHLVKCPKCFPETTCSADCKCIERYSDEEYEEVCANQVSLLLDFNGEAIMFPETESTWNMKTELYLRNPETSNQQLDHTQSSTFDLAVEHYKDFIDLHYYDRPESALNSSNVRKLDPLLSQVPSRITKPDLIISQYFPHPTDKRFCLESMKLSNGRQLLCLAPRSAEIYKQIIGKNAFDEVLNLVMSERLSSARADRSNLNLVEFSLNRGRFSTDCESNTLLRKLRNLEPVNEAPPERYYESLRCSVMNLTKDKNIYTGSIFIESDEVVLNRKR
jgi:hypothetical protein